MGTQLVKQQPSWWITASTTHPTSYRLEDLWQLLGLLDEWDDIIHGDGHWCWRWRWLKGKEWGNAVC